MSYTTSEKVRQFLAVDIPLAERIVDQEVKLTNVDAVKFYGSPLDAATFIVKSPRSEIPNNVALTLSSGVNSISSLPLVRESIIVASDSSLGIIYEVNVDYIIDEPAAELRIKSGGLLSAGQSVTVWYREYAVYQVDSDYQLDASRGTIKRTLSGQIAEGEIVVIDYTPQSTSVTDELIDSAVITANGLLEREVDPDRQFEADSALVAAATFRALEIVSLAAASKQLSTNQNNDRAALAWLKLAEQYDNRAIKMLSSFRPPLIGPAAPVHG